MKCIVLSRFTLIYAESSELSADLENLFFCSCPSFKISLNRRITKDHRLFVIPFLPIFCKTSLADDNRQSQIKIQNDWTKRDDCSRKAKKEDTRQMSLQQRIEWTKIADSHMVQPDLGISDHFKIVAHDLQDVFVIEKHGCF